MSSTNKFNNLKDWHRLDNTGKAYPLIRSSQQTTLFRLTTVLNEKVDPLRVKEAIKIILLIFPYFQVVLKPGFFGITLKNEPAYTCTKR